jgi:hypothetical protein
LCWISAAAGEKTGRHRLADSVPINAALTASGRQLTLF